MTIYTTAEVAEQLRVSPRKIRATAARIGAGLAMGGRAGFRYEAADIERIKDALRPEQPVKTRRRRGAA